MYAVHSSKITFRIRIEDLQAGVAPCAAEVNPEAPFICEGISDPAGAPAVLHNDNNVTSIVEIPYRNTSPFTGLMADCLNDKRIFPGIRRTRDTNKNGKVSDLIRNTDQPFRKAHLTAPLAFNF